MVESINPIFSLHYLSFTHPFFLWCKRVPFQRHKRNSSFFHLCFFTNITHMCNVSFNIIQRLKAIIITDVKKVSSQSFSLQGTGRDMSGLNASHWLVPFSCKLEFYVSREDNSIETMGKSKRGKGKPKTRQGSHLILRPSHARGPWLCHNKAPGVKKT